jgi:hypothetical protein
MTRECRNGIALLTVTALWALAMALSGHTDALLYVAPAVLLAVPLAFGRYPGEQALERLREAAADHRPRPVAASDPAPRGPAAILPRGGRLIAAGMAERGPPAPAPA